MKTGHKVVACGLLKCLMKKWEMSATNQNSLVKRVYVLWAKTKENSSEVANLIFLFFFEKNAFNDFVYLELGIPSINYVAIEITLHYLKWTLDESIRSMFSQVYHKQTKKRKQNRSPDQQYQLNIQPRRSSRVSVSNKQKDSRFILFCILRNINQVY